MLYDIIYWHIISSQHNHGIDLLILIAKYYFKGKMTSERSSTSGQIPRLTRHQVLFIHATWCGFYFSIAGYNMINSRIMSTNNTMMLL